VLFIWDGSLLENTKEFIEIEETQKRVALTLKTKAEGLWHYIDEGLSRRPELRKRINPLTKEIVKNVESTSKFINQKIIEKQTSINEREYKELIDTINQTYDKLELTYMKFVDEIKDYAKLSKEEIEDRKRILSEKSNYLNHDLVKKELRPVFLRKEISELRIFENYLLGEVSMIAPHGRIYTTIYFPCIVPSKESYSPGEKFEAEIFIGNYLTNSLGDHIVIINGKDHRLIDGFIKYEEIVPNKKGMQNLKLELKIHNPFSNDYEYESSGSFEYEIK